MRGNEAIVAARMAGTSVDRIDIEVLPDRPANRRRWTPPGLEVVGSTVVGRIEVYASDNPMTADLRCCYGLPVLVLADSYDAGWPIAQRVIDCDPLSLHFAAPDFAARFSHSEGLVGWEL